MANEEFKAGDIVRIVPEGVYYTGKQISPKVKSLSWVVSSISGKRVVLGKSADGHYDLNIPINADYLIKDT